MQKAPNSLKQHSLSNKIRSNQYIELICITK